MFPGRSAASALSLFTLLAAALLPTPASAASLEVPAGKTLEIRLTKSLASFSSKKGGPVEGILIAPVGDQSQLLLPAGTKITGTIQSVTRVGLGLIHETAHLTLSFNQLTLPDGSTVAIHSTVSEIDNARENVNQNGKVQGIRSTGTIGYRANNLIAGVAMFDPIAYIYVTVASARMLRFSEPEIWFPAGTELSVKLVSAVLLTHTFAPPVPSISASGVEKDRFRSLLRALPFRTVTENTNKPSDLTNLAFLGSPAALQRAFVAAGWVHADRLNSISGFLTLRSIAESQRYQSAPMSVLLLDEQRPVFTFSKSLDTFSKRHHVRVFLRPDTWQGKPLLTASSTQDIGIQISRKNKTFIHVIDTNIDNERAKIVNDLIFTGCVDAAEYHPRPWIPKDARNSTGEALRTDGRIAVLQLNDCLHPRDPVDLQKAPDIPTTGPVVERGFRQGFLITRNDIYRGNLLYQGFEGAKMGIHYFKHRNDPEATGSPSSPDLIPVEDDPDEPQLTDPSRPGASPFPRNRSEEPVRQNVADPGPLFELGVEGGWLGFGNNLSTTSVFLDPKSSANQPIGLFFANRVESGWAVGTSVTLNSWRYFSNEFSFDYQRGRYRLGLAVSGLGDQDTGGYEEAGTGILANQFGYAFVANLRPREKRFRPYVAAGPIFELLRVTDAPFKTNDIFRVGLRNVGLIVAAYNFANHPPLDGGGVFQFGFQYGAGIKYRVARHWMLRADYRESLSPQPNFIERSITIGAPSESDEYIFTKETDGPGTPLRLKRVTLGFSFVF